MPLHKVSELADKGDKRALLCRQHFNEKYDDYYMERTSTNYDEDVIVDEDTPGLRRTVNIICISVGYLGVKPLPSECDVIIVNNKVFVAGEDEYNSKFTLV